jgi:hypothetical protein
VLGEDLSPEAIIAASRDAPAFLERLEAVDAEHSGIGERLPPLGEKELRPLLDNRSTISPSFAWAEANIDRLTAALLYSHSAVAVDPLYLIGAVRKNDLPPEHLLCMLHYLAVNAPLLDSGTLFLIPELEVDRTKWISGPWPKQEYYHGGENSVVRWIEERTAIGRWASDLRPSRIVEDSAFGRRIVLDLMQTANALDGRAHFFLDHHSQLEWSNAAEWDEMRHLEAIAKKLFRGSIRRSAFRARSREDARRVAHAARTLHFFLRDPVPDLSIVSAHDLVLVREADAFEVYRLHMSRYVDEYLTAIEEGMTDIGSAIAAELRESAAEMEREVDRSPALSAMKAGLGTMAVGTAAGTIAEPIIGRTGFLGQLGLSLGLGAVASGRRVVAAHRDASKRSYVAARASVARAAAERFDS